MGAVVTGTMLHARLPLFCIWTVAFYVSQAFEPDQ